ncbi:low-density lipoprotein receptor-related protein 2-like [Antedon mediterranea]|uniref:low-density lipoprotein receptor-related protein 2-like n=1 Tax=Antedon mediterranea TaxID=105859 RepID=UPI003AF528A0
MVVGNMSPNCVVLILAGFAVIMTATGEEAAGNRMYLAVFDHRYSATYIEWIETKKPLQNETLFSISYASLDHHWTALAVDYHTGNVTFHDKENHWIFLSDDFVLEDNGTAYSIEGGTSGRVNGLAIDWLAKNVYWVDEGYNWIKMTNYTGGGEVVIADVGFEKPSGIACHPSQGYLFWTELGDKYPPKIERSTMAGNNRITIVDGLTEPRSIAVDTILDRIYWTDNNATAIKVESSDLDGNGRRTEISEPKSLGVFDSIAVDEDYIYVVLHHISLDNIIRYYKKAAPNELVYEYNVGTAVKLLDLCVAGPNIQSQPVTSPCDGNTCGHYCVSAANNNHECLCRDNYVLHPNGTCSIDLTTYQQPFCVIGRTNSISSFHPTLLHYDLPYKAEYIFEILSGTSVAIDVTAIAIDIHSNLMFFADDSQNKIFYARMEGGEYPVAIHEYGTGRIDGMAVDWLPENLILYYVDYVKETRGSLRYDGESLNIQYDVTKPTSIAIDPFARYMFWTEETSPAKVVRSDLDFTNRRELTDIGLQNPTGMTVDLKQKRIYIVGSDSTMIYSINYDGTIKEIIGRSKYPAIDITIYQDFMLLAEPYNSTSGIVEAIHISTGEHEGSINVNSSITAIEFADESTQPVPIPTTKVAAMTTVAKSPNDESSSIVLIGGVGGAVVVIIILLIVIICVVLTKRSKRPEPRQEPFARDGPHPNVAAVNVIEPPTYESIATGNETNIIDKKDLGKKEGFDNALYMTCLPPPRYSPSPVNTPATDTEYVDLNVNAPTVPNVTYNRNLFS